MASNNEAGREEGKKEKIGIMIMAVRLYRSRSFTLREALVAPNAGKLFRV